jgi:hypothetical protein
MITRYSEKFAIGKPEMAALAFLFGVSISL